MTDIPIRWEAEVSPGQRAYFTGLLAGLARDIDPGDSLKEVRIVEGDEYDSKIQALMHKIGRARKAGTPLYTVFSIEEAHSLSNVIFIHRAFFTPDDEHGTFQQTATLVAALYYCRLYHLAWQRRGYFYKPVADPYTHHLFTICEAMHDEYAVARLQNTFVSQRLNLYIEAREEIAPLFIQYNKPLALLLDQVPNLIDAKAQDIRQLAPSAKKDAFLPIAYYIFKPLALHAGFLAPIPPSYPFRDLDNDPEKSAFYRDIVAPYWIPIQSALEASFDSQFSKTEEALQAIAEMMDACLNRLLKV